MPSDRHMETIEEINEMSLMLAKAPICSSTGMFSVVSHLGYGGHMPHDFFDMMSVVLLFHYIL